MKAFLLRKLGVLAGTVLLMSVVSFGLIRLVPGDPVLVSMGERALSAQDYAAAKAEMGLDKPLWHQYLSFLKGASVGEFGRSITTQEPVTEEFFDRLPATLELGVTAIFIAVCLGIPLGVLAALKHKQLLDRLVSSVALLGYSMPIFWWGLMMILLFSSMLHWFPISGRMGVEYFVPQETGFMLIDTLLDGQTDAFWDALWHLFLPALVMSTIPLAQITRMTRSSLLEVLEMDYVRAARARGLSRFRVIAIHALRNALIPVVTVIGLSVSSVFRGAVLTETVFSWPGIGRWLVVSVTALDYPVIQGSILLIAILVLLANASVDAMYAWINPRLRAS